MNGATSPAGDEHPGEILFDDQIDDRQWTERAGDVPQTIAWVEVDDEWHAVTRIEITGTPELRRMTSFGVDGEFLESTIQGPPPPAYSDSTSEPLPDDS